MARAQLASGVTNVDFLSPNDDIGKAIIKSLEDYSDSVADGVHEAVDIVSEKVMSEIKGHITFTPRKFNRYIRAFALKDSFTSKYNKRRTWHVKGGQYRLTHLLEDGHRIVLHNGVDTGRRTRAFPHVKYGEDIAKGNLLPSLIEKVIKGEPI